MLIDYQCFIYRIKDSCDEDNYTAVHGCLLRDGMSMGKVTEAEGTIKPLLSNNTSKVLTKS